MSKRKPNHILSEILGRIVETLEKSMKAKREDFWEEDKIPGKWTKKEILGHLIDSAVNNHRRFLLSTYREHLVFEPYDQEEWVRSHNYLNREAGELIDLWKGLNFQIINIVHSLNPEKFVREYSQHNLNRIAWKTVPLGQPTNLAYLLEDYIGHLNHHIKQIFPDYRGFEAT